MGEHTSTLMYTPYARMHAHTHTHMHIKKNILTVESTSHLRQLTKHTLASLPGKLYLCFILSLPILSRFVLSISAAASKYYYFLNSSLSSLMYNCLVTSQFERELVFEN